MNARAFGNRDAVRRLWLREWLMILSCQQVCPEFCVEDLVLFLGLVAGENKKATHVENVGRASLKPRLILSCIRSIHRRTIRTGQCTKPKPRRRLQN